MRIGVSARERSDARSRRRSSRTGHDVRIGARAAGNEHAATWAAASGPLASEGTFADAAAFGELATNATAGAASLEALEMAGRELLAGKVLIDVATITAARGMEM